MQEVVGKNYLCVYAMIEMILKDIGEETWDQIRLANKFGVTLPVDYDIKEVENTIHCANEHECGAHIDAEKLNSFFEMEGIPLRATYLEANPFNCYDVAEEDDSHKYIVYLYSYGSLNDDQSKINVGHASIKVGNIKNGKLSIFDPGPLNAGVKEVNLSRLYDAINDYSGGILILERIPNNE